MIRTKNGYLVNFDTTKRKKHNHEKILKLFDSGTSIRKIADKLNIPFGSIHYVLRTNGRCYKNQTRPDNSYLTFSESKVEYGITRSQFDYVKNKYPNYYKNVGGKVFIKRKYFELYTLDKKGYKKNDEFR